MKFSTQKDVLNLNGLSELLAVMEENDILNLCLLYTCMTQLVCTLNDINHLVFVTIHTLHVD